MKSTIAAIVITLALAISAFAQGPFGFERGMTRDQIIKLVGGKPGKTNPNVWITDRSPIPNSHFENFMLFISPTQGLLKVNAIGKDVQTSDTGSELKSEFATIRAGVTAKYGTPENDFDFCKHETTGCSGPSVWMLGLIEKNAVLMSGWRTHINQTATIALEAKPLGLNKGYCTLDYEFDGWDAFVDAQTAKQDQSF